MAQWIGLFPAVDRINKNLSIWFPRRDGDALVPNKPEDILRCSRSQTWCWVDYCLFRRNASLVEATLWLSHSISLARLSLSLVNIP